MAILASATRTQLAILKPSTALDSSDEARTDASASPSMNPEPSPSATSSDASIKDRKAKGASASSSSSAKRRKEPTASGSNEDTPAPKQRKYERKTKRFIWPDDLHRLFVAAIFDVGLKNASPKALLSLMDAAGPNAGLTTEHLKSHLQKYRLNYERSRAEFLEYYDRSAKRNLKRRRRQAQQRAGGASGDANTMFVFPISNSKHRKGDASDSDSDDSDSDAGVDNNSMDVDARGSGSAHATPRGQTAPSPGVAEGHPRGLNYSQLMQGASVLGTTGSVNQRHPAYAASRLLGTVPTSISAGVLNLAAHHLPPGYAAASRAQRKQSSDQERELAAATAAAVAYRYPPGQVNIPVSSGMPELSDPQWSILNSLMSPQLTGMTGPGGEGAMVPHASQIPTATPTNEATGRSGSGSDGFMLHEEPTDMQLQMHLAMQAQMNLHRQMLTRKVEVAQHLARHSSMGAMDASAVSNSSNRGDAQTAQSGGSDAWNNAQLQQQHQYQQQQQQYQQPVTLLPRPSVPVQPVATQPPIDTASANDVSSGASMPAMPSTAAITRQPSDGPVVESAVGGLASETKNEDDTMDLYRWDRIDLNVGLDDDDLFGFLKS
ncbi:hypothetical protein PHYBOEH_007868 [Phytophthora boehmeriae]|uniref:Myb-like domain-containing protein n=1 Tax=Phytophthora boehmeriae TaxID=109152 RepID=A0A8T1W593_9STRA|nr:hypothetical protein PHYBOEH_007868 [Phytophthora boehmeriae]